jgi:multidrug efflux pump subunit AcrB
MNFSAYAIRNPVLVILLFGLLTLAGVWAFRLAPVQEFPDIELPIVTVSATLEGAAPAQLETEVARKIEDSVATVQGVKHIHTTVLDGEVSLVVEFVIEKDASDAVTEVRDAVSRVRSELPGDLKEPVIGKASTAGRVVQVLSASSATLDEQELSWFVDDKLAKALLSVPGVGAVKRVGGATREVRVELDPVKMAALNVSALDVSRRLKQVQQEAPGGRGDVGGTEQAVRTIATVRTAAELAAVELPLTDGRRVRLDQVARLADTVAEQRSLALQDGQRVVGVEVFRSRGASELDVAAGVRATLEKLAAEAPQVELRERIDNSKPVQENFDGSMHLLYEGAVLAVLVVWWFLRDWRATLVAAAALPLSAIPAFLGMAGFGFTLNTVTLLALALVVGILVDDAIVEVENISRHLRMGKSPLQAALDAADEIGLAVIATTFALVAVFLPTAFMGGIPGKFFKQFGWTAVVAILASLLVARFLTPVMAAYLLRGGVHEEEDGRLMAWYLRAMRWCLRHRALTAFGAGLFFVASVSLVALLPTGFVPAGDRAQTQVNIELPPGSTLAETLAVAERAREVAIGVPEVKSVFSSVGGGSSGDVFAPGTAAEARRAVLTLTLSHRTERHASVRAIEGEIRRRLAQLPGARFGVGAQDNGVKMQIVLQGEDAGVLAAVAQRAERELRTLKGIGTVSSSATLARPEIVVRPDFARAADLGVTAASLAETVRVATAGDYGTGLPKLNLSERQVPVRVKLPDSARADLQALRRLTVPGPGRTGPAGERGRAGALQRAGADRPAGPSPQRDAGRGAGHPQPGRTARGSAGPALAAPPAAAGEGGGARRHAGDAGAVRQLRPRDGRRRAVHLGRAGAAVQGLPAAGDHPGRAAAVDRRRLRRPARHAQRLVDAVDDRAGDADGRGDEELDPAGGVRDRGAPRRHGPHRRPGGRLPQAQPADRDDHHRHGRRHAAAGPGPGRRPELPPADGDCGTRRPDHVHALEPAGRAGGVHVPRRRAAVVCGVGAALGAARESACGGLRP